MSKLPLEVAEYFPYNSARPHQDDFIATVNQAVNDRRSVLIEGCNGLGKTISALSACLPVAMKKNLKILYVARTHRQHDRVIEELRAVYKRRPVTGISIRGRNEMCLQWRIRLQIAYGSLRAPQSERPLPLLRQCG
jgi:DNA excision repair protein ERCC-2